LLRAGVDYGWCPPFEGFIVCNDLSKVVSKSYGRDPIICTKEKNYALWKMLKPTQKKDDFSC
jgi:hypothetical protein